MPVISLRISESQKKEMDEMKWINWSELIRSIIQDITPNLKQQDLGKAIIISDLLRKKMSKTNLDTMTLLRTWRN